MYGLYIDIAKWPDWVEKELYAWTAPVLVAQRFRYGPRYFFADSGLPVPVMTMEFRLSFNRCLHVQVDFFPMSHSWHAPTSLLL